MTHSRRTTWLFAVLALTLAACQPGSLTATPAVTPAATSVTGSTPVATDAGPADAGATATPVTDVSTDGPAYALALHDALAACANAGRDQVCYGSGDVTLTARPGATLPAFAQPGDVVDLADVAGLSLGGGEAWGLAVLRLQAGLDEPDQNLTVVAMGAAEISDLNTVGDEAAFDWTVAGGDLSDLADAATPAPLDPSDLPDPSAVEPLQSFTFTNAPAADDAAPSGLFLMSPWEGDLASVEINGAAIALGSMAFIQTEPGGAISVGMFEGGSLVTVGDATFSVPAGAQSTLPASAPAPAGDVTALDPRAQAIANAVAQYGLEATDPRAQAISDAIAQYGQATDPRADAVSHAVAQYAQEVARYYVQQYRRAIRRCTAPNSRYVYNVLYWDNKLDTLRGTPELAAVLGANGLAKLQAGANACLSFELDFDSTVTVASPEVTYVVEVKAEAVKLQYANTGFLQQAADGTITHVRFEVTGDEGSCPSTEVAPDGTLKIAGGFIKVHQNELEVMLDFWPDVEPEQVVYHCPNGADLPLLFPWFSIFAQAHMEEFFDGVFRFYDWDVSENEHFAETIYDTDVPMDDLSGHVTTYMVLVHTPQAAP